MAVNINQIRNLVLFKIEVQKVTFQVLAEFFVCLFLNHSNDKHVVSSSLSKIGVGVTEENYESHTHSSTSKKATAASAFKNTAVLRFRLQPRTWDFEFWLRILIVGSVIEWLKRRDRDRHGLGSKPTRAILLCPWERHVTALSPAWWPWQAILN